MGIGALLRGADPQPRVEQRAAMSLEELLADTARPTSSGQTVNADTALRLGAVWRCVALLSDSVAMLPVRVETDDGQPLPLPRLLAEPAAGMPFADWIGQIMRCLLLAGNAHGVIVDRAGIGLYPSQVELVHPDRVGHQVDADGRLTGWHVSGRPYLPEQVFHVRAFSMPQTVPGLSPIRYAAESIGLGLSAEQYGASYLGRGAVPTGVLTSANPDLTLDEAAAAKAGWQAAQATRSIAVLNANTSFQPISVRPDEAQFLETMRANVAAVARVFGVPPEMIGGDAGTSMTYANISQRSVDFLKFSVQPWLIRLEGALSRLLPPGQRVRFDTGELLRTDTQSRYEAHQVALSAGFLTLDEVRTAEGLAPLPARQAPTQGEDDAQQRAAKDLHAYWTRGAGLARWRTAAQPLLELHRLLARNMTPAGARAAALAWFAEVMGRPPVTADGSIAPVTETEEAA